MKNYKLFICTLAIALINFGSAYSQNGIVEAEAGVIVGNNNGTEDGTIRYTGADFEGRKSGNWVSLTSLGGASMWEQNGSMIYYNTDNVGIGTNVPQVEFHVEGSNEIMRLAGTSPWLSLRQDGNPDYAYNWFTANVFSIGVSGLNELAFKTNSSTRMRINDMGDIGIGTNSPSAKLHIKENDEALRIDGDNPWISFYDGASYKAYLYHDGDHLSLSNEELGKLSFRTNSLTRMTIEDNGNVGVGAYNPVAKLDVRGDAVFNEDGGDNDFRIESDDDTHALFVKGSTGWVGIGNNSPQAKLHVAGNIKFGSGEEFGDGGSNEIFAFGTLRPKYTAEYDLGTSSYKWVDIWATNGTIQTSDRRLKKDIVEIPYGLSEIMKLKPVKFKWNNHYDQNEKLGLIAQDVLPIVKEVVKTHHYELSELDGESRKKVENERLGVYYSDLIPVLIKAMQEQQMQIDDLKNEIKALKKG